MSVKKFFNFEQANEIAKIKSVIMARLVDADNDEILYHWFKYDNDGNLISRKYWINAYCHDPDDKQLFQNKDPNSEFDDGDFYSEMWYEYC